MSNKEYDPYAWMDNDFVCRNNILNGFQTTLYDVHISINSVKTL
jgi:hypothetical protein